jgi:hypothetical protein
MKKGIVHLGSAHSMARPARPSGPAPLGVSAHDRRNRGGGIPFDAGGLPAKSGRPVAVGRRGSSLGVTSADGDPDLGRRAAEGSPWRAHGGDGSQAEGCIGEGVGRLSLARLVRSVSTSELRRCYWWGRQGRRSTGGGGRQEGGLSNEEGGRLGATTVLAEGSGVEAHEGGAHWPALGAWCGGGQ